MTPLYPPKIQIIKNSRLGMTDSAKSLTKVPTLIFVGIFVMEMAEISNLVSTKL